MTSTAGAPGATIANQSVGALPGTSAADIAAQRVADYTGLLAVFTLVLCLCAALQAWAAFRGERTARSALAIADKQVGLASAQAEIIKKQHSLQRWQALSALRPRLHVRNVVVKGSGFQAQPFTHGQFVTGQFYVSNIGGSPAQIVESYCEVFWTKAGLPMQRPYEAKDGNSPLPNATLEAGASLTGMFASDSEFREEGSLVAIGGPRVYVMGWIDYLDQNYDIRTDTRVRRRTAFCRQFQHRDGSSRFYPVDDPDYEHEE